METEIKMMVRVIKIPIGEAPENIKKEWIGVEFPCHNVVANTSDFPGCELSVVDGSEVNDPREIILVDQEDAIKALEKKSEKTASWWKNHGFPKRGRHFTFGRDEVEIIEPVVVVEISQN